MTALQGIWDLRRERERSTGRPVEIYRAYPFIGRGSVLRDTWSHAEVERRFQNAMRITAWQRIRGFVRKVFFYA